MQIRLFTYLLILSAALPALAAAQADPAPSMRLLDRLEIVGSFSVNRTNTLGALGASIWPRIRLGESGRFTAGVMISGEMSSLIRSGSGDFTTRDYFVPVVFTTTYALTKSRLQPFVGLGVGIAHMKTNVLEPWSELRSELRTPAVFNLHLGATYQLSPRWSLHVRGQADFLLRTGDNRISLPFHLGAAYRFGR